MSHLALAPESPKSPGRRAIDLMQEAKAAGDQQVTSFLQTLELACRQAAEIASGGEVYPAGVRDVAAKLAEHTAYKAQSIYSIMRPTRPAPACETLTLVESDQFLEHRSGADEAYDADFPELAS
jgi:hypothetical protein